MAEELLVPVLSGGTSVYDPPPLAESRALAQRQLEGFYDGCLRLDNPHEYPVGLEQGLHDRRARLIQEARGWDV